MDNLISSTYKDLFKIYLLLTPITDHYVADDPDDKKYYTPYIYLEFLRPLDYDTDFEIRLEGCNNSSSYLESLSGEGLNFDLKIVKPDVSDITGSTRILYGQQIVFTHKKKLVEKIISLLKENGYDESNLYFNTSNDYGDILGSDLNLFDLNYRIENHLLDGDKFIYTYQKSGKINYSGCRTSKSREKKELSTLEDVREKLLKNQDFITKKSMTSLENSIKNKISLLNTLFKQKLTKSFRGDTSLSRQVTQELTEEFPVEFDKLSTYGEEINLLKDKIRELTEQLSSHHKEKLKEKLNSIEESLPKEVISTLEGIIEDNRYGSKFTSKHLLLGVTDKILF